MKAEQIYYRKEKKRDGTLIEISIWQVPADKDRWHGFKYRLHYGHTDGQCIVRYDNEKGRGDHKHTGGEVQPYIFASLTKLLDDFESDIEQYRRQNK